MEVKKEDMISLKVLVDKTQNRVLFAEAGNDFVDILFSFLTLPMGTVVRLIRKQSQSSVIGCLNTLYAGLEKLEPRNFQSGKHKDILLHPKNSSDHLCRKLKLNIDDTQRPTYNFGYGEKYLISETFGECEDGVFVKQKAMFIVSEDLKVMPLSSSVTFKLLMNLGVQDINSLEEKVLKIGLAEILSLLKFSLLSKTPLTDLLLMRQGPFVGLNSHSGSVGIKKQIPNCTKMILKIILRKSNGKLLYVEAKEDFVDHLLSILTLPLGSLTELLISEPLGCVLNLHSSVKKLSVQRDLKSQIFKDKLLSPKLSPQCEYKIKHFGMMEFFYPAIPIWIRKI